jgi:hypothetical protein
MALKSRWNRPRQELFLAVKGRVYDRIEATFREATASHQDDPLAAIGTAYRALFTGRDELLLVLHSFPSAGDPQVQGWAARATPRSTVTARNSQGPMRSRCAALFRGRDTADRRCGARYG